MAGLFGEGGGGDSAPKKSDGGIGGWIRRGARDIRGAVNLPAIAKGLGHMAADVPKTRFNLQRGFYVNTPEGRRAVDAVRRSTHGFSLSAGARALSASGTLPSLLPGVQTVAGGWKGFHEHPVLTILDVLPYAGKVAAVGRIGAFMEEGAKGAAAARLEGATEEAALRAGKAVEQRALRHPLRTVARDVTHNIQQTLEAGGPKAQAAARLTPAKLLEHWGLGKNVRDFLEKVGPGGLHQRRLVGDVKAWVARVEAAATDAGLSHEDMMRLATLRETGAPGWRSGLTHREGIFMHFYDQEVDRFRHIGITEKRLFEYNGETYSKAEYAQIQRNLTGARRAERRAQVIERVGGEPAKVKREAARYRALATKRQAAARAVVPSRWKGTPVINDEISRQVKVLAQTADPALTEEAWTRIAERLFSSPDTIPGVSLKEVRDIARNVSKTWLELKKAGYDPGFMHHVGLDQIKSLERPRITPTRLKVPSEYKTRAYLVQPYVHDLQVSLLGQGIEFLERHHSEEAVKTMVDKGYVLTKEQLNQKFVPMAERLRVDPNKLIARDYMPFDPNAIFPFGGKSPIRPGEYYIPKNLAGVIDTLRAPKKLAVKVAEVPVTVFRTSILTLNPGYYLHIALATGTIMLSKEGPGVLRYFGRAFRDLHEGRVPVDLATHGGDIMMPGMARDTALLHYAAGRTLGRLLHAVGKLESVTGFVHDMSESMAYLYERAKGEREGLTPGLAHTAAIDAAHSLFQRWDRMTPLERTTIRTAFPFYGWSNFLFRYVMTYPFDHPIRASIVGNFGRHELDDWKSGVPERFMSYFFFGKPDASGRKLAIPVTGAVPFMSVPNLFSISGIYSHLNPEVHFVGRLLGLSDFGNPDLYPQMSGVDPVTGQITIKHVGAGRAAAETFIPQVAALEDYLGLATDLKSLRQTNPEAWRRLVRERLGGRFYPTRISLEEEAQKTGKKELQVERSLAHQAAREATTGGGGSKTGLFGG